VKDPSKENVIGGDNSRGWEALTFNVYDGDWGITRDDIKSNHGSLREVRVERIPKDSPMKGA